MKKLLFVVHRYPHPNRPDIAGGSEYNTQRMAEEAVRQGHEVWVLTDEHGGDHNGVRVTSDRAIVNTPFDMIIPHGSCPAQDFIHWHSEAISKISPIYYLLVQTSDHPMIQRGMQFAKWIGCGTSMDWEQVKKYGHLAKGREYIYGIDGIDGQEGFKARYGISDGEYMYLSAGGFWPHKQFDGIIDAFNRAAVPNTKLVLLGYDNRFGPISRASKNVIPIFGASQQDVYDAMYEADLYILNSTAEGYGLVLLEAMYNECDWISRPVGGAPELAKFGFGQIYNSDKEFVDLLKDPRIFYGENYIPPHDYIKEKHMVKNSVESILKVLDE